MEKFIFIKTFTALSNIFMIANTKIIAEIWKHDDSTICD